MSTDRQKEFVRIDLSVEQKDQVKAATGREAETLQFTIHELEERIAPRLASNHNETLLGA